MDLVKLYDRNGIYTGKFLIKEQAIQAYKRKITGSNAAYIPTDIWNQIVREANIAGLYIKSQLANMKKGQVIV